MLISSYLPTFYIQQLDVIPGETYVHANRNHSIKFSYCNYLLLFYSTRISGFDQ